MRIATYTTKSHTLQNQKFKANFQFNYTNILSLDTYSMLMLRHCVKSITPDASLATNFGAVTPIFYPPNFYRVPFTLRFTP